MFRALFVMCHFKVGCWSVVFRYLKLGCLSISLLSTVGYQLRLALCPFLVRNS